MIGARAQGHRCAALALIRRGAPISPAVALRPVEHLVFPDPAPDDMRLTVADRRCERERGSVEKWCGWPANAGWSVRATDLPQRPDPSPCLSAPAGPGPKSRRPWQCEQVRPSQFCGPKLRVVFVKQSPREVLVLAGRLRRTTHTASGARASTPTTSVWTPLCYRRGLAGARGVRAVRARPCL